MYTCIIPLDIVAFVHMGKLTIGPRLNTKQYPEPYIQYLRIFSLNNFAFPQFFILADYDESWQGDRAGTI